MSKLNEAKELVDNLKRKAAEQSLVLAEKQTEADNSLREITTTMQARERKRLLVMCCVSLNCHIMSESVLKAACPVLTRFFMF